MTGLIKFSLKMLAATVQMLSFTKHTYMHSLLKDVVPKRSRSLLKTGQKCNFIPLGSFSETNGVLRLRFCFV